MCKINIFCASTHELTTLTLLELVWCAPAGILFVFLSRIKPNEIPLGLPPSQLEKRRDGESSQSSSAVANVAVIGVDLTIHYFLSIHRAKYSNRKRGIFNVFSFSRLGS